MENLRLRELFRKRLENNLLPNEADEIQAYIADPVFEPAFKSLITKELEGENSSDDIDEAELTIIVEGLETKVLTSINQIRVPNPVLLYPYIRYAVAALIMLLGSWIYISGYKTVVSKKPDEVAMHNEILPGTNRASLRLDDGNMIQLSEKVEGIITNGKQLRYKNGLILLDHIEGKSFTLSVPRGGKYQLELSDGTKVWLNAVSSITYPGNFERTGRKVKVQGESYFEVKHDQTHPFFVETEQQTIKVLGTEFNVNTYSKTKPVVTLVEGSIALRTLNQDLKILKPGDQAIEVNGKIKVSKVNAQEYIAWTDDLIVMDNQDVKEIFEQLERWYDVEFINKGAYSSDQKLSGEIPRNTALSSILNALEIQLHVKFKVDGRKILIT